MKKVKPLGQDSRFKIQDSCYFSFTNRNFAFGLNTDVTRPLRPDQTTSGLIVSVRRGYPVAENINTELTVSDS